MNGIVGKRVLIAATAAIAMVGVTGAASANNCNDYAKLTLQQAKQNVAKGCNYQGARWSLDIKRHMAWCKDAGPRAWRSELKIRNEMLAKCKR